MKENNTYIQATGRRKTSSARCFLKKGTGLFIVKKSKAIKPIKTKKHQTTKKFIKPSSIVKLNKYFTKQEQIKICLAPLKVLNLETSYDVLVTVKGGGFTGQAGAIRHALSRALLKTQDEHRVLLKKHSFLTRDSRMVERKKYGHHKARKSTQFSKR